MTATDAAATVDLTNCEREPIHIPGSVQPRGALFACEPDGWRITHATANATSFCGKKGSKLLGTDLKAALGASLLDDLAGASGKASGDPSIPGRRFGVKIKGQRGLFNVSAHAYDGRRIVEIEPATSEPPVAPLDLVRVMLSRLQQSRSLHELCDVTVAELRELIGFDRVMIYRFLQDGSGQVIAEARTPGQEPLLNLRYPASDIPRQARELYKRNWVRLISDVHSAPVPISALGEEASRPLDLSFADLRSVSPIHIEYLKNMGVSASMSISIIVGGELWGLIACHHRAPRVVAANIRAAAELLGQVFSLQIQTVEGIEAYVTMRAARALLDRVVAEFPVEGDLVANLASRLDQLAAFIPCDGVGVWMDGIWRGSGAVPTAGEAKLLGQFVQLQHQSGIYSSHSLAHEFHPAADWKCGVRGVLAVPLSHTEGNWLFFFRTEVSQAIEWGGNPNQPAIASQESGRISPRQSFEAWKEEVKGQALPWTSRERLIGDTLRIYLLDIIVRFSEVIREERRQAEQKQRLLTTELNHRVKGTLELIQSLVVHGYGEKGRVQSFVRTLEGRIRAIALAHDAISVTRGSEVRNLVESAVSMHGAAHGQVDIHGPEIKLDPKAYTVLALVIHEMMSNAAAYGALSVPEGHLSVSWFIDPASRLVVMWEERGGPPVLRPQKEGLGLVLVRRNIPHALSGDAEIHFEPQGVTASFIIPSRYLANMPRQFGPAEQKLQIEGGRRPLEGYTILLVEDQMTTAIELERMLRDRGAASVQAVGTAQAALATISQQVPDVAILDVDLGDETSIEVADALARLQIPFVFAAAEIDLSLIPPQHREVQVVSKPYSGDAVAELLKDALMPHLIRAVLTRLV